MKKSTAENLTSKTRSLSSDTTQMIETLVNLFEPTKVFPVSSGIEMLTDTDEHFRPKEIEEIIKLPATTREETVLPRLYAVNFVDSTGYMLIDMNANRFPIVSYKDMGKYAYDVSDTISWNKLKNEYANYESSYERENLSLWQDIVDYNNNPALDETGKPIDQGNVCITTIEFQPSDQIVDYKEIDDDVVIAYEDIPHDNSLTMQSIPDRDQPLYRPRIWPLIEPLQLKWHYGAPYNASLPYCGDYYDIHAFRNLPPVPFIALAFAKIMYYYRWPETYNWSLMPKDVSGEDQSAVSSLIKEICDAICVEKLNMWPFYDLKTQYLLIFNPRVRIHFNFQNGLLSSYDNDQNSFNKVYESLWNDKPVLFARSSAANYVSDMPLRGAWIVDGYSEMRVKVVKSWYFMGIRYKRRVYYYYRDYFHYIASMMASKRDKRWYDSSKDGWYGHDYATSKSNFNVCITNFAPW